MSRSSSLISFAFVSGEKKEAMEAQQEICITVNEAAKHIGSCVRQTDRFIKVGKKEGDISGEGRER